MISVIMAGGSGTRFWPLSRSSYPKQFLKIVGDQPLLRATYERIRPLSTDEEILVVVGREHEEETRRILADTRVRILVEPFGRNTAPCVGLAARYAAHLGATGPLAILPADHYVADPEAFQHAIRKAATVVQEGGIATLGIVPTRPETGYGYIERQTEGALDGAYRVRRFVEKPPLETAAKYFQSGRHYWNAGIFVATATTLLKEFAAHMPEFAAGLDVLARTFDTEGFSQALEDLYGATENISFDYAVMEKTREAVYVVPTHCGWSDVGSWYSLYDVRRSGADSDGNVLEGDVRAYDCRDSFVVGHGGRFLAVLGLQRVLVVDTKDAVLVADLERSQEVRRVVQDLKDKRRQELL
ncbi:mannose-1-phosphate guanylyltransferase [Desulfacinum hydrothermale DSM 13146]|uniref:mannose-1-phosphate guanylyltransferase n=1 Tax=Desulfacinum hydrothermale DSM 13146 TaxID=1121390 RepID=A0A1W1XT68_9BACT|nr:mannose-1-phosphate guanylyltransferase [Desulfacinum hydrothermale]SMC27159.1 mannose-1-phosphate guanylyltransferase [Desulfacinum hydrothermale DSM 13146]